MEQLNKKLTRTITTRCLLINLLLLLIIISGCGSFVISSPPVKTSAKTIPIQELSSIEIPISIKTNQLKKEIINQFGNPILSGSTDWINATKIIAKLNKTKVRVNYTISLNELSLLFNGTEINTSSAYTINITVDSEQTISPIGAKITRKDIANGHIDANIKLNGNIQINDNGEISINIPNNGVGIDFTNLFGLSSADLVNYTDVVKPFMIIVEKQLENLISKQLTSLVKKAINKNSENLIFKDEINHLIQINSEPVNIIPNLWLVPNPEKIALSQIRGTGIDDENSLALTIGIISRPVFIANNDKPLITPQKDIPIIATETTGTVNLYPEIKINLELAAQNIHEKLKKYIENKYKDSSYTTEKITIYPSNQKVVFAIDVISKKNNKKKLTFYLFGIPVLDKDKGEIYFKNIDYTIETKSLLLKIAKGFMDGKIQSFLEDNARYSYKEQFDKLHNKIKSFDISLKNERGIIHGSINEIEPTTLFISEKDFIIYGHATGKASIELSTISKGD